MTKRIAILCCLTGLFFYFPPTILAQSNSWTNSTSGKWEDSSWSLGVLPGTNQTILFTNSGWKALAIGPNTAQNFPQTLTIDSLTVSSPGAATVNTLLMNYSGFQTPLTLNSLSVGSNCLVTMYSSSLMAGSDISVDGRFNQNDSIVTGSTIEVGGIYNLTNGTLSAATESASGEFNQQGGTNAADLTLSESGEYDLFDGVFSGGIILEGGDFNQWNGDVSAGIEFAEGNYHLAGGVLTASALEFPASLPGWIRTSGTFLQTGGTNVAGNVAVGNQGWGTGSYTLSDGALMVSGVLSINYYTYIQYYHLGFTADSYGSSFYQSGGVSTNNGIYFNQPYNWLPHTWSSYVLAGGILITPSINLNVDCNFFQRDGTNAVGIISVSGSQSYYGLAGGWLLARSIQLSGSPGSFYQSGGTNQVADMLLINGGSQFTLAGGQLTVPAIQLSGAFQHDGGTLNIPGVLTMANGSWVEQAATQKFGALQLGAGANSVLSLATNACVLDFADSSNLVWSNAAVLLIQNWAGSLYGGGSEQIIFGSNSAALTSQQLSRIQFKNPAGLPAGNYPVRILVTGEIVPDTGAPLSMKMTIAFSPTNPAMQLNLCGDIGQSYDIEVSTDMVNWAWWTNQFNSNGTISIPDCGATNYPQRFYRARPVP